MIRFKWFFCHLGTKSQSIDHIRVLGIELELACNGGSRGGISLKIFAREKIGPHKTRVQASSSSIPRIRNRPIGRLQNNFDI